ncbi:hypothetical protein OIU84_006066 [Salix udensis]|uniref:Uncharacterized protein n=1 Tax=Salix udensis TaxID=889485 RepID=A0AAD6P1Q7_9ROSI|nr:hypothetical protein OIU84_006066 [Salix udensis]
MSITITTVTGKSPSSFNSGKSEMVESLQCKLPFSSPDNFSLHHRFFSLPKGSATWPQENLPASSLILQSVNKSQHKFLQMEIRKQTIPAFSVMHLRAWLWRELLPRGMRIGPFTASFILIAEAADFEGTLDDYRKRRQERDSAHFQKKFAADFGR